MNRSLDKFYEDLSQATGVDLSSLLPPDIHKEIGHFNVFNIEEVMQGIRKDRTMPYNRRAYYKISLVTGRNRAEYADKVIAIEHSALLFGTPKVPYHWLPENLDQRGHFCIFTDEFLLKTKSGVMLDELPIFRSGGYPVFQVAEEEVAELNQIFVKMHRELASNYAYKYDLLRNYVLELIHYGQKLQPATTLYPTHNAAARVSSLFIELLERQFPIESPRQQLSLRTAKDYADRLAVHVNHLNKVLKEQTGKTTTALISGRVTKEAMILLKQTDWTVSEIAWSLGFDEVAHFSNFFKREAGMAPLKYRA